MSGLQLVFDADDTLWENNIYFEQAFEQFYSYLAHSSLSPDQVRAVLNEIEIVNAQIHGYGSRNFARNLSQCFRHLAQREVSERDIEAVSEFAHQILHRPPELIPGVEDTLDYLAGRHSLVMFTKGDADEQRMKVDRSGLAVYFQHIGIVKEKDEAAYRDLACSRGCILQNTYMIGNSPKSDINPALAAGFNAVYVPHPRTWSLERDALPVGHPRLLTVERITDLRVHF
jgi:putative hydrolase of the HAD superfamily